MNIEGIHYHNIDNYKVEYNSRYIRIWDMGVTWANIEKQDDNFDFSKLDYIVDKAIENKLEIVMVLGMTPKWATNKENIKNAYPINEGIMTNSPDKLQNYYTYVSEIGNRYKGKIKYWQVWNEFDNIYFWSGLISELDDLIYLSNLCLKSIDKENKIIMPSITSLPNGIIKLYKLYNISKDSVDIISLHSYKIPFIPIWVLSYQYLLVKLLQFLHKTKKPIFITEYGIQNYKNIKRKKLEKIIYKFNKMFKFFKIEKAFYYAADNEPINEGRLI